MLIEDKKRASSQTRTRDARETRHLRAVPSRPEAAPVKRSEATGSGPRDRVSDSGEREEETSPRVHNILYGLQQDGEGLLGDLVDGATDVAGGLVDGATDVAGDLVDRGTDLAGDVAGGARDAAGGVIRFLDGLINGHRSDDSRLAEDREENASVAVIDYFAEDGEDPEHGDIVESILRDHSGLAPEGIQRYRAGGGPSIEGLVEAEPEEFGEALDSYIEGRVTGLLDASSGAIEDILADENSNIRTINQSLGVPESRIAGDIAGRLQDDPAFRERFMEYAGLGSDASEREVMQALVDEVGDSRRSNETIQESKERYDRLVQDAYNRGITTTDSSGNYGSFARELEELGVETDDQFHTDVLNNPLILSVGGTDTNGTATLADDEVSSFSSPNAGADIAAQGSDVTTVIDGEEHGGGGTSFAAPQVAAAAAVLAEQYPELSAGQIRAILLRSAENPGLERDLVGAGIVQQDSALDLAEQLAA
jgi:subtilisin family serine protease